MRSHREISQPSRRSYVASTGRPAHVPVTRAVAGPPYCMVQTAPSGAGAKTSWPHRVSRSTTAQAPSVSGWSPPTGWQYSSYVPSMPAPASRTVTVRWSPSGAAGPAPATAAEGAAQTEARAAADRAAAPRRRAAGVRVTWNMT